MLRVRGQLYMRFAGTDGKKGSGKMRSVRESSGSREPCSELESQEMKNRSAPILNLLARLVASTWLHQLWQ